MTKNPDKWIRKGIIDALGDTHKIYDMRVPATGYPSKYIILSTQTKLDNQNNKCSGQWDCTILLDLVTRYTGTGNPGDRVDVNDLEDYILANMGSFDVDGFNVFRIVLESSTSLDTLTDTMNVFRQLVRYRIILDEVDEPVTSLWQDTNIWNDTLIWQD